MTTLTVQPYCLPAATMGPENPLPVFRAADLDNRIDFEANRIPEEDRPHMGWRTGFRVLPYRLQDSYDRVRQPRDFFSVVLENDHLRVTVLPEIGGLVTEILHKATGKHLIAKNSIFQPGNLALRNAWVYGGIEWNTAQLGHHYLTLSPFHTARLTGSRGEPALRLYAWERVKCFPFQIDLHLPPDSAFLFARVRVINPHDQVLPMYWWTNMGVDELPGRRYLAPASTALKFTQLVEIPILNGVDHSYPTRPDYSYDLFCRVPPEQRKWLAVIDTDGTGLVHTSTARLTGRKLFAWGTGPGGIRWQEQLCGPGQRFFEVQAGLARTQLHSLPMPARSEWTWTEAFGHIAVDPARAHGPWAGAWQEVGRVLESRLPSPALDRLDQEFAKVTASPPVEVLFHGLGWGALEKRRAARQGEPAGIPPELPYTDADLGPDQQPWLALLEGGALPEAAPEQDPGQYMIQPEWQALLEASIAAGPGDHWLSWLHLGVMRLEAGDDAAAASAWERSIQLRANGWAWRNLAALALRHEDPQAALGSFMKAWQTGPQMIPLALEILPVLNRLEKWEDLRAFLAGLPPVIRTHERVQLELCKQALRDGALGTLMQLLDRDFDGIREGETILSDLWFGMHEKRLAQAEGIPVDEALKARVRREYPPPSRIDFRMWTREANKYVAPQAVAKE